MVSRSVRLEECETAQFIDEEKIWRILNQSKGVTKEAALAIVEKARDVRGLLPEEAAVLLHTKDPEVTLALFLLLAK